MYFHKTHPLIRKAFPNFLWKKNTEEKVLYLTFDDGPIPEVTDFVLRTLDRFSAKATFFCVGQNISRYPKIYQRILQNGHRTGNHTFNHLNAWETGFEVYMANTLKSERVMRRAEKQGDDAETPDKQLFRPPYGKITPKLSKELRRKAEIVMWDVLTGDFDPSLSEEKCLQKAIRKSERGSIVTFHDSLKAESKLRYVLPAYPEHFSEREYRFLKL